jgi:hypothetical protein
VTRKNSAALAKSLRLRKNNQFPEYSLSGGGAGLISKETSGFRTRVCVFPGLSKTMMAREINPRQDPRYTL